MPGLLDRGVLNGHINFLDRYAFTRADAAGLRAFHDGGSPA
ncbi:hypothetical protein [Streptosporangium canum]